MQSRSTMSCACNYLRANLVPAFNELLLQRSDWEAKTRFSQEFNMWFIIKCRRNLPWFDAGMV